MPMDRVNPEDAMSVEVTRRRFTVEEYYRMAAAGILAEDDRVELIEGEIHEMAAIGRRHAATVDRLATLVFEALGRRVNVRVQNPVQLSSYSEVQPDVTLLRRRNDFYEAGHPTPADVLLLMEVADSTLLFDRRIKIPLYARMGVAEVWLVNLESDVIEVYRDPSADGYRTVFQSPHGQRVTPAAVPDLALLVDDILG
jgi:Uma2 family endonuclease